MLLHHAKYIAAPTACCAWSLTRFMAEPNSASRFHELPHFIHLNAESWIVSPACSGVCVHRSAAHISVFIYRGKMNGAPYITTCFSPLRAHQYNHITQRLLRPPLTIILRNSPFHSQREPEASRSAYCNLTSHSDSPHNGGLKLKLKLVLHTYNLSADDMKTGALNIDENMVTL